MQHEELTRSIIGCAFEVVNELGAGYLESVYHKAMEVALRQQGFSAVSQHPLEVMFRQHSVGTFYADLLVEGKILVEIKAVKALASEHQAQVINYLMGTGIEVGLLLNFGSSRLEYKRLVRHAT